MTLICICQNKNLGQQLCDEARRNQWDAHMLTDRNAVLEAIRTLDPDLLLVEAPDASDFDWYRDLKIEPQRPVVFMGFELSEEMMIRGWECGAVGFLPRGYVTPRALVARLKAFERLQGTPAKRKVPRLGLVLDSDRTLAQLNDQQIDLTMTEFKILRELATDEEKVISRQDIQQRVFGSPQVGTRSLDVHICALRKKVKAANLEIESVRGVGYRLSSCRP